MVTFNQVVGKGDITIYNPKENGKPLVIKEIANTNFESITLKNIKGNYRIEINIDGQQFSKTIHLR